MLKLTSAPEATVYGMEARQGQAEGTGWAARGLALLPVITALGAAAIYGVGALFWLSEVRGAGVPIADTFPLIPLAQILAKGIPYATLGGIVVPFVVIGVDVVYRNQRRTERQQNHVLEEAQRNVRRYEEAKEGGDTEAARCAEVALERQVARLRRELWALRTLFALLVPLYALLLSFLPLFAAIAVGVGAMIAALALRHVKRIPSWVAAYLILLLFGLGGLVVETFINPRPLPYAEVTRIGAPPNVSGTLIVATDSNWYISPRPGVTVVVPNGGSATVAIAHRQAEYESLFQSITGIDFPPY